MNSNLRYITVFQKKVKFSLMHMGDGEFRTSLDMFIKELTQPKMTVSIGGASIFETKIITVKPKSSLV